MAVANVDIEEFEIVSDGLSEAFMKRAVKGAAAFYLSKADQVSRHMRML